MAELRTEILAMRVVFGSLIVLLLAGCATRASLTISSNPDGAYITENNGKAFGVTPVTAYYDPATLPSLVDRDGCFIVDGFTARWVSGATAESNKLRLCGSKTGDYTITFTRDPSAPGFAQDMQFALQVQQVRAQQQQAQATEEAADAALFQASSPQKSTFYCTTTQVGAIVQANCR
jgi:hypothetical protein